MKKFLLSQVILAASTGLCLAGGPTAVTPDPMPEPATPVAVHDWSGPYVGLSYGTVSGDMDFSTTPVFELGSGNIAWLYAGYLMQRGSLVYGGELAYGSIGGTALAGFPNSELTNALDLKARVGVAANRALFYGVLGYSTALFDDNGDEYAMDGVSYGFGVDFAVSNSFTVGLEYLSRDLSGEGDLAPPVGADSRFDSVSLRVGFAF